MSAQIIRFEDLRREHLARKNAKAIEDARHEVAMTKLKMAALIERKEKDPTCEKEVRPLIRALSERHYELYRTLDELLGIPRPEPHKPNPNRQAAARKGAAARWEKHRARKEADHG